MKKVDLSIQIRNAEDVETVLLSAMKVVSLLADLYDLQKDSKTVKIGDYYDDVYGRLEQEEIADPTEED